VPESAAKIVAIDLKPIVAPVLIRESLENLIQRIWPPAAIVFSLVVTLAWTAFVGYWTASVVWLMF
jgi:hypothetical protein